MANNLGTDNPFSKAFGEKNFSGLPVMAPVKEMAARYIDTSEQWVKKQRPGQMTPIARWLNKYWVLQRRWVARCGRLSRM